VSMETLTGQNLAISGFIKTGNERRVWKVLRKRKGVRFKSFYEG